jgi:signal transduction histidine kinase
LRSLLENLIGNAWKFTSQREDAVIELGVEPDGRTFYVRDNGVGFDAEQAATLFKPFERLPAHQQFEGTGLGLATAQRIIERHEGHLRAEGRIGVGATFWFCLP